MDMGRKLYKCVQDAARGVVVRGKKTIIIARSRARLDRSTRALLSAPPPPPSPASPSLTAVSLTPAWRRRPVRGRAARRAARPSWASAWVPSSSAALFPLVGVAGFLAAWGLGTTLATTLRIPARGHGALVAAGDDDARLAPAAAADLDAADDDAAAQHVPRGGGAADEVDAKGLPSSLTPLYVLIAFRASAREA